LLSSLHIAGFKSLSEVNIDLGRINVIIGANGSGKSNLLEAIGVLGAAASGSVEPETLRYRGVRPGLPTIYKSSFQHERIRRVITLTAESSLGHFQVGLDNPISSTRTKWRIHSEDLTLYRNGAQKPVVGRSPRGIRLYNSKGALEFLPEQPATDEITMSRSQVLRWADTPQASELIDALINFAIFPPTPRY